jgi:hypothetical protein
MHLLVPFDELCMDLLRLLWLGFTHLEAFDGHAFPEEEGTFHDQY